MKLLAAILMLAQTTYAETRVAYACQMEGSTQYFRIVENQPHPGQATIYSPINGTVLRFTETTKTQFTKLAKETVTKKIYFHPFYEYQLSVITREYYLPTQIETKLVGEYISEMNPNRKFTCVRTRNGF